MGRIRLEGYEGEPRPVTITGLGREEPAVSLTNHSASECPAPVTRYGSGC